MIDDGLQIINIRNGIMNMVMFCPIPVIDNTAKRPISWRGK